jgi:Protein of unknown function (DUF2867)
MSFKTTALITSVICFCLAGVWAFGSAILLNLWGVDYAASAELVGRRGAALFLGVGVMLLLARDAEPSQARTSLTVGLTVACTTLALLGVLEFVLGNAGFGILSAVIVELVIALAFLRIELMTPYRTRVTDLSANGQGERRVPNTAADVLQNSKSAVQVAGAYFCDVYQIGMPRSNRTALQIYLDVVSRTPLWVNILMDIRNFLGKTVFGLKDLGRLDTLGEVSASNQTHEGARIGVFTLRHVSDKEVLLGDSDKHLTVVVSTMKQTQDFQDVITVTTVVHVNNTLGRIYMLLVVPVHRIIVPTLLKRGVAKANNSSDAALWGHSSGGKDS